MPMARSSGKEKARGGIEMTLNLEITFEECGVTVTCEQIHQIYGCGDSPADALAMFWRELKSLREDLASGGNFSEDFVRLRPLLDGIAI